MKKLLLRDIENIIKDFSKGDKVALLSIKYKVEKATIYYHIKQSSARIVVKPMCYNDYIILEIRRIEKRISQKEYSEDKVFFVKSHLSRLKGSLKIDRSRFPNSADILQ